MDNALHLVDGTFELYRAHYSKRPSATGLNGQDVKACLGMMSSLRKLLADPKEHVTHIAVAFDNPIVCFRNDLFAGYKTDAGVPSELRTQFDLAEACVRALGIVVWSMDRFEADDALATAAKRYHADFSEIRILSPDKDLLQTLTVPRTVLVDRIREREVRDAFAARGVRAEQIPDLLALTGDDADGIPGLAGFGAKTATALLAHFDSIESITPPFPASIRGRERLEQTFVEGREDALLYKKLATLVDDVPLTESASDLAWHGENPELLCEIAERLGRPRDYFATSAQQRKPVE